MKEKDPRKVQTYRIEIRFDFTGTEKEVLVIAQSAACHYGGDVTAIFDEEWEELDL